MDERLWAEIRRMYFRDGLFKREIARRLGIDRETVSRALKRDKFTIPRRQIRRSKLAPYKGFINNLLEKYPGISAQRVFEELCKAGYKGKGTIIKDYLRKIRGKRQEAFLRIETLPGEQAQVDWADCGSIEVEGARRNLYCFVMVLSWSRYLYLEFRLSARLEDFIEAHMNAFRFFGGVPKKVLYDNLKSVVLQRLGDQIKFNPRFMDFVGVYLFEPVLARLYRGSDKGKVENNIKYIKGNFLIGREFRDLDDLMQQAVLWRDTTANVRIHGTTREKPLDRYKQEKYKLNPLPDKTYEIFILTPCKASSDCRVRFETNSYSVPHRYAGCMLSLKANKYEVFMYYKTKLVASHKRCYGRYRVIENPGHIKELLEHKKRAIRAKVVDEFKGLGKEAQIYLNGLIEKANNVWLELAKLLKLRHRYGVTELLGAINKALPYNAFGAAYIENIIITSRKNRGEKDIVTDITMPEQFREAEVEEKNPSIYDALIQEHEEEEKDNE